jgi:SAM-dependent methyltransferase
MVVGVDFADNMIRVARQTHPELAFQVANGEALPFDDSVFDVIVCNYTAHHFARPELVFREVLRVLKAGSGRLVIVHPVQSEQAGFGSFAQALYEVLPPEQNPGGPLLDLADPQEYVELLTACGYLNARCEKVVKPVDMHDLQALLDLGWKMTGLAEQPQEVQDTIRAGTIARAEQYKSAGGGYHFPDVVLVAVAEAPL